MIYLLEDDESIRNFVIYALNNSGMETRGFETPSAFYAAVQTSLPELVLLDIMLPEEDGISVLRNLKKNAGTARIPVIMLTARGTEYDKVVGLDSGADDYVSKPFGIMELISRVRAVMRRCGAAEDTESCSRKTREYRGASYFFCPERHELFCAEKPVHMPQKEFELLCMFFDNPGLVLSRDRMLTSVWGYGFDGESRTVDVHINSLRQKLAGSGLCIETVRGFGYKLVMPDSGNNA